MPVFQKRRHGVGGKEAAKEAAAKKPSATGSDASSGLKNGGEEFALPHLERPSVPQMLLYADTILGILGLLFSRPFSLWICRMHGSWRRRRIVFLMCWVLISGFVVLDSLMSGYGALSSYCGFAIALQLCFFALSLLGSLFPSVMLRAFRCFGFCIHGTLWVAAIVPIMNGSSLSALTQQYPPIASALPRALSSHRFYLSFLLQFMCALVFSVWIYLDRVTFAAVFRDDYVRLSGYEKMAMHLANIASFLPLFLVWYYLFAPPSISLSDFGAYPPWNTIILVGAAANCLLLWLLTSVSSLWVGFPMWMWNGRALIIQHRGDTSDPASLHEILMRISGQFASEYLVYQGLQAEVKKAFATGNFKY